MVRSTRRRAAVGAAFVLTGVLSLTACGPAPWAGGAGGTSAPPSPTRTAAVGPQPVPNDLSSGSTERALQAGAVAAAVNYWSTLSMDQWTPTALKPVSLSLTTTVTPDDGQQVGLQRVSMIAVPANPTETFAPLEAQLDQSNQTAGYPVLAPYSYSQTFNIGEVPAAATHVTLQFTYEFLVQTTPTSAEYAKQTTTDAVRVAIAGGGVAPASED
ncbi:hypothetical protein [Microbacterium sp. dk485]|uniref:hypothetical protein n=1 Tax=Microbacterium sp. dk485 TaxID=2560021 RepID=UPI001FD7E0BD|nr:hypothetical protein [Microbacterium sp. dk485]